jgi:putative DNA primase/helicase
MHRTTESLFLVHSKTLTTTLPSSKIALINGLLDPKTQVLEDFTPDEFVTVKMSIIYDVNAKCPEILKFFNEIAPEDMQPQFEEIFGYCLLSELPIHKTTVLLGEGSNGKSTFLDLLTVFLGKENVCHVSLQEMCEGKFERAELQHKLANIVDDLPGTELKMLAPFKTLTGNAPIMAQRKYGNPFNFWNTSKTLFGCNKLPKASEDTIAFYRRFNIIPFTRFFIGATDDKDKLKKMTTPTELSGLLNLALAGLKRLLTNGDYTNCKTIEENRQFYIKSSDSCKAFAEEMLEASDEPQDHVPTQTLYRAYVAYCKQNRLPKLESKPQLTQAIRQTFPDAEQTTARLDLKVVHVWQYLKLKNVASVADVTGSLLLARFQNENIGRVEKPVTNVTLATNSILDGARGEQ